MTTTESIDLKHKMITIQAMLEIAGSRISLPHGRQHEYFFKMWVGGPDVVSICALDRRAVNNLIANNYLIFDEFKQCLLWNGDKELQFNDKGELNP